MDINGTAEEVATLLARFSGGAQPGGHVEPRKRKKRVRTGSTRSDSQPSRSNRAGPKVLLEALAKEDFFKSKRTLSDVQKKLEEMGHIYAQHSISTPILRLTRSKVLRRIKEKNGWVYVS